MSYGHILQALGLNLGIPILKCYVLVLKSNYKKQLLLSVAKEIRVKYYNDAQ